MPEKNAVEHYRIQVASNGDMVLPVVLRQQLHVEGGGLLIIRDDEGSSSWRAWTTPSAAPRPWSGVTLQRHKVLRTSFWPIAGPRRPVTDTGSNGAFVLDASALLALLFDEPGVDVVRARLRAGIL